MTHRFPIKEIAAQSGLSTATVDRVLNARANVSAQTRARVLAAIDELRTQEGQLAARGRRLFVDVVVEAPQRFSREIRRAADHVLPQLRPFVLRPRFATHEVIDTAQMVAILDRIARRGSDGVCLKARDVGAVRDAVDRLQAKGIPVVTLVTDLPRSARCAYAGLDNLRAGRTAAELMALHHQKGHVLIAHSRHDFEGEATRNRAFVARMEELAPDVTILTLPDTGGLNAATAQAVARTLSSDIALAGVYSASGGNRAIHAELSRRGQMPGTYIAHDLDADNLALLRQSALTYVLHHDLEADLIAAFRHILAAHRLTPPTAQLTTSDIQIVVRSNIPQHLS